MNTPTHTRMQLSGDQLLELGLASGDASIRIDNIIEAAYSGLIDETGFLEFLAQLNSEASSDEPVSFKQEFLADLQKKLSKAEKILNKLPELDYSASLGNSQEAFFNINAEGVVEAISKEASRILGASNGDHYSTLLLGHETLSHIDSLMSITQGHHIAAIPTDHARLPLPILLERSATGILAKNLIKNWPEQMRTVLGRLFELTPTEIDIAENLYKGLRAHSIAEQRKRSLETVRTQIRTIFDKTQARGMHELIVLLYTLATAIDNKGNAHNKSLDNFDCVVKGQGSETLIFIHGCLGGRLFPSAAEKQFEELGLKVLSPARPGHGKTPTQRDIESLPQKYAKELSAKLTLSAQDNIHIVGFDMGCPYACALAELLDEKVKSLVLVSPLPPLLSQSSFKDMPFQQGVFPKLAKLLPKSLSFMARLGNRRIKEAGKEAFPDIVLKDCSRDYELCRKNSEFLDLCWNGHFFHVESGSDGFVSDTLLSVKDWPKQSLKHGLAALSGKTTIVHGALSQTISKSHIEEFANEYGIAIKTVPDAGHLLAFTHWQAITEIISSI